jgi:ABC-type bacteriocin/lantibiotic exporter with double-glycine peptidase domain
MPIHDQGQENSCGTTSLAMSMAYLGVPGDFNIIDRSARFHNPGAGVGTAPGDMVQFARRSGLQAQEYNDSSMEDLVSHVRAGRPVTVLLNYQPDGSTGGDGMAHYLNVIGFNRDSNGEITDVILVNPWGREETMSIDNFKDQWSDVSLTRSGIGRRFLPIIAIWLFLTKPIIQRSRLQAFPGRYEQRPPTL